MILRLEEEKDYKKVEHLIREAFWNVYKPGCDEHYVMHKLRNDPCFVSELDYIIEENGEIVAHIAYAKGTLKTPNGETKEILLFGPVGVLPSYQKQGYGSKIIEATLEKAKAMNYPCVVITGNPNYYQRFGFVPATTKNIKHSEIPENIPVFMVKVFNEESMKDMQGIYYDPSCYYVNQEEVEVFDQQFPPKVKEVRPGQL